MTLWMEHLRKRGGGRRSRNKNRLWITDAKKKGDEEKLMSGERNDVEDYIKKSRTWII